MKKLVLSFLSSLYAMGLAIHQNMYQVFPFLKSKVKARVISIGNLTWGGTGKTPLTARLAADLQDHGKKVVVLVRGYNRDEVLELEKKLDGIPVIANKNRSKAAREAIEKHGAQVLILDDGFQHWALDRDVDVVNINSTDPFGPGGLIPSGNLREPMQSLGRGDLFVLTKSNLGCKNIASIRQKINAIKPNALIFEAQHKPVHFVDALTGQQHPLNLARNRKAAVISAIADPLCFEKTLETLGIEVVYAARFEDHHDFTVKELEDFIRRAQEIGAHGVVTTRKDFCRMEKALSTLTHHFSRSFFAHILEIEFELNEEEDFVRRCLYLKTS